MKQTYNGKPIDKQSLELFNADEKRGVLFSRVLLEFSDGTKLRVNTAAQTDCGGGRLSEGQNPLVKHLLGIESLNGAEWSAEVADGSAATKTIPLRPQFTNEGAVISINLPAEEIFSVLIKAGDKPLFTIDTAKAMGAVSRDYNFNPGGLKYTELPFANDFTFQGLFLNGVLAPGQNRFFGMASGAYLSPVSLMPEEFNADMRYFLSRSGRHIGFFNERDLFIWENVDGGLRRTAIREDASGNLKRAEDAAEIIFYDSFAVLFLDGDKSAYGYSYFNGNTLNATKPLGLDLSGTSDVRRGFCIDGDLTTKYVGYIDNNGCFNSFTLTYTGGLNFALSNYLAHRSCTAAASHLNNFFLANAAAPYIYKVAVPQSGFATETQYNTGKGGVEKLRCCDGILEAYHAGERLPAFYNVDAEYGREFQELQYPATGGGETADKVYFNGRVIIKQYFADARGRCKVDFFAINKFANTVDGTPFFTHTFDCAVYRIDLLNDIAVTHTSKGLKFIHIRFRRHVYFNKFLTAQNYAFRYTRRDLPSDTGGATMRVGIAGTGG